MRSVGWVVVGIVDVVAFLGCGSDSSTPAPSGGGGASGAAGGSAGTGASAGKGGTAGTAGTAGTGGTGAVGGSGGDSGTGGTGGTGPSVCPYTADPLDCTAACANLKTIAAKCQNDPGVPQNIQAVLAAAATGTGNGCKVTCAADSPSYTNQWKCFQGVPPAMDCTAIAGCTYYNCP